MISPLLGDALHLLLATGWLHTLPSFSSMLEGFGNYCFLFIWGSVLLIARHPRLW